MHCWQPYVLLNFLLPWKTCSLWFLISLLIPCAISRQLSSWVVQVTKATLFWLFSPLRADDMTKLLFLSISCLHSGVEWWGILCFSFLVWFQKSSSKTACQDRMSCCSPLILCPLHGISFTSFQCSSYYRGLLSASWKMHHYSVLPPTKGGYLLLGNTNVWQYPI